MHYGETDKKIRVFTYLGMKIVAFPPKTNIQFNSTINILIVYWQYLGKNYS
jgi:hypothetical protein